MWKGHLVVLIAGVFPDREHAIKRVVDDITEKQSGYVDKVLISGCEAYLRTNKTARLLFLGTRCSAG